MGGKARRKQRRAILGGASGSAQTVPEQRPARGMTVSGARWTWNGIMQKAAKYGRGTPIISRES